MSGVPLMATVLPGLPEFSLLNRLHHGMFLFIAPDNAAAMQGEDSRMEKDLERLKNKIQENKASLQRTEKRTKNLRAAIKSAREIQKKTGPKDNP